MSVGSKCRIEYVIPGQLVVIEYVLMCLLVAHTERSVRIQRLLCEDAMSKVVCALNLCT